MRKVPHRLRHSTLGLQLVVLFREVLWPCWRNYIIAGGLCEVRASPHFHFALCFVFVAGDVVFQHPDPSSMPAACCRSPYWDGLYPHPHPGNSKSNKLFHKLYFTTATGK